MAGTISRTPPRRRGRPPTAEVDGDTRARIVDAAIVCFARDGYAKASNKAIAKLADVTAPSLYHYFESKAALYHFALREANASLLAAYRAACIELPDAPAMEQLCLGLEKVIELSQRRPGLMSFAAASAGEIVRHDELDWLDADEAQGFPRFFRGLLLRARRRGELRAGIDIDSAVKMLIACVSGLGALHGALSGPAEFARVLRAFEHMLQGDFCLR